MKTWLIRGFEENGTKWVGLIDKETGKQAHKYVFHSEWFEDKCKAMDITKMIPCELEALDAQFFQDFAQGIQYWSRDLKWDSEVARQARIKCQKGVPGFAEEIKFKV